MGNAHNYTTVALSSDGTILPAIGPEETVVTGPEDRFDEGNSMDLSPVKLIQDATNTNAFELSHDSEGRWAGSDELDDTFRYRRR